MELTLHVPGLRLPAPVLADTLRGLALPTLSLWLGRAERLAAPPNFLASAFGLPAPLPTAALRKLGAGRTAPGTCLCLDPVHWAVRREGITLTAVHLDADEADALIADLQPWLADWGSLGASAPNHWELVLDRPLDLATRPLPHCLGLPIDPALPGGPDGQTWRRLLADVQTFLHTHPVNRQRDALGRPVINSLWPWGAGSLPEQVACPYAVIWGTDPHLAGLGQLAGIPCLAPPATFQPASGQVLCQIDGLREPALTLDALAWREALLAFERDWLMPVTLALQSGACTHARLVATDRHDAEAGLDLSLTRRQLWRFWRRPAPLTALA